nr:MAG TPA: hypothetical protein [Caudoviricetes sp.]
MIDCNITKNYLSEQARMTKSSNAGVCRISCNHCPLSRFNNDEEMLCTELELRHPEKAIAIVQKWSDEHPQTTYLNEFLKNYPNAELNHGVPKICLKKLGVISGCAKTKKGDLHISCYSCWNQPIPIEDGEE